MKVTSIDQRGKYFQSEFDPGDTIKVFFPITMEKNSKNLFPEQSENYPGLKINESFKAIAEKKHDEDGKEFYWIYRYEK